MSALFLTGSSVGLLVHGILPPEMRAQFDFVGWFIAALPLHAVLFVLAIAAVVALYRPAAPAADVGDRLALQRAVLGPIRRDETPVPDRACRAHRRFSDASRCTA